MYSDIHWLTLKLVAIVLGLFIVLTRLPGVIWPEPFRKFWLAFPRSKPMGWALMGAAMAWSAAIIYQAGFIEVVAPKTFWVWLVMAGFYLVLVFFMEEFLAVRGLAFLLLLIARVLLDVAFPVETQARLVVTVVAYLMVVAAMVFTVAPWRMRDALQFLMADNTRCRWVCACGTAFGVVLVALGVWVY